MNLRIETILKLLRPEDNSVTGFYIPIELMHDLADFIEGQEKLLNIESMERIRLHGELVTSNEVANE